MGQGESGEGGGGEERREEREEREEEIREREEGRFSDTYGKGAVGLFVRPPREKNKRGRGKSGGRRGGGVFIGEAESERGRASLVCIWRKWK